jgi:hypothetical protein
MKQTLAIAALALMCSRPHAAETPSNAAMLDQQIKTCRAVMAREGATSPGMKSCMATLYGYSKNREEDTCRVLAPANATPTEVQQCAAQMRQAVQQQGNSQKR